MASEMGLPAVRIEGTLTTTGSPTINLSGAPFSVTIDSANRMLVTMGGPFGMTLAQLLLTQDHFVMVNYLAQEVWDGDPDAEALKSQMHLPVQPSALLALFRGRIPGDTTRFSEPLQRPDGSLLYRYTGTDSSDGVGGTVEFALVDGKTGLVKQYQIKDATGVLLLDVTLGEYKAVGEAIIPHRLDMTAKNRQESATITITDAEPWLPGEDSVELTIPPSYSRRALQ